jgi:hypothetical protein
MAVARSNPVRWDISTAALLVANATPLFGVLFLHWQVFPLLLLYWLENVVVGFFNVLRMATADPADPVGWIGKLFMIPFFCVHYGMFCYVHGIFVLTLFSGNKYGVPFDLAHNVLPAIRNTGLGFAVLSLASSHAVSFFVNYIHGGEYRRASLGLLMAQPYSRVMILHFTILLGGFAMLALGSPVYGLLMLVLVKTGVDVAAHRRERQKLAEAWPATSPAIEPARVA